MTIDDELFVELFKPQRLAKIVGTLKAKVQFEEPTYYFGHYEDSERAFSPPKSELVKMTPDITVTFSRKKNIRVAIELENDIKWDFGESLRQLKKYKAKFRDTRVIIPEEYKRFAPIYKNEGFRVYLWKAKRKWQCLKCGTITEKEGPIQPQCKNEDCKNKNRNEFRLVGLQDTEILEA